MKNTVKEIEMLNNPFYQRGQDDMRHKIAKDLEDVLKIQCSNGNWNYDPYMMGLANGLIMAHSIMRGGEPTFLTAPKKWIKDYPTFWTRIKWFFHKPSPTTGSGISGGKNEPLAS